MKLPSSGAITLPAVGTVSAGVTDCLPITTPSVTVLFAPFVPFTRTTVGATLVVFVPSVKVAPALVTLDSLAPSLTTVPALVTFVSLAPSFTVNPVVSRIDSPVVTLPSLPLIVTTLSVPPVLLLPPLKVVTPSAPNSTLPEFAPLVMLLILVRFLFIFTVNVVVPLAATKMLPLADLNPSTCSFATPSPTMFTNVFKRCLFTVSELLPVNCKPSSIVAT